MEPPRDEAALIARARALGGRTIPEVAASLGVPLPPDPRRAKGFVGQLAERALGGSCDGRAGADFPTLGVELKTLPVDAAGRVRESTFVCTVRLRAASEEDWASSRVREKLARVLFLVVEADPALKHGHRRFGAAWLWSPSLEDDALLAADYQELSGRIGRGDVEALDARLGRALQLRPKGANARARALAYDADGAPFLAPARGFYLRARFTTELLARAGLGPPLDGDAGLNY